MRIKLFLYLFIIQFVLFSGFIFSSGSQITVSISKLTGYIGETFDINLILKSQISIDSIKVDIKDEDFEIISKRDIVSKQNTSYQIFEKKIKIVFWKTGNFKIKPIIVKTIKDKKIIDTLESNQLEVTILSSLEKKEKLTEKDLKHIRPLAKLIGTIFYFLKYLFFLLLIIALIIFIVLYIRKKIKQKNFAPEIIKTPVEEFNINFTDLEKKKLIISGKLKLHFLKLTEITKRFLRREYNFNAEELTSFETIMFLKEREKEEFVKEQFDNILSFSDRVKFAKFIPKVEETDVLNKKISGLLDVFIKRQEIQEQKEKELERIKKENVAKDK